jgi:lysophospholipase L1-like esterase
VGSNISKWKGWIGPLLDSFRPTHVLFSQGGNDFGRSGEAVKVAADIDSFLQQIKSAGAIAMWVAPPETPFPDVIGVREMWWDRIAKYWRSIDSRELQIPRAGDSLGHPSQAGYKLWSEWIWPWFATVTWT